MKSNLSCAIASSWCLVVLLSCSRTPSPPAPRPATAPPEVAAPAPPSPAQQAQAALAASLASDATATLTPGFVVVPPGSFVMGAQPGETDDTYNDAPPHPVTITRAFEMQTTEVTQAQYRGMGAMQPSQGTGCDACPVVNVSWLHAAEYCNALSRQKNLPTCHGLGGVGETFAGLDCRGYRLPTEAEWEYAARAGTTASRYGPVEAVAWIDVSSGLALHPVGTRKPNAWGLHDMLGNVFEWTYDWQGDYPTGPATDPLGPLAGQNRVFRGGSFKHPDVEARAGFRNAYGPQNQVEFIGFRCVRTIGR